MAYVAKIDEKDVGRLVGVALDDAGSVPLLVLAELGRHELVLLGDKRRGAGGGRLVELGKLLHQLFELVGALADGLGEKFVAAEDLGGQDRELLGGGLLLLGRSGGGSSSLGLLEGGTLLLGVVVLPEVLVLGLGALLGRVELVDVDRLVGGRPVERPEAVLEQEDREVLARGQEKCADEPSVLVHVLNLDIDIVLEDLVADVAERLLGKGLVLLGRLADAANAHAAEHKHELGTLLGDVQLEARAVEDVLDHGRDLALALERAQERLGLGQALGGIRDAWNRDVLAAVDALFALLCPVLCEEELKRKTCTFRLGFGHARLYRKPDHSCSPGSRRPDGGGRSTRVPC